MREKFTDCLTKAQFKNFSMTAIENLYGSGDYNGPWFKVQLEGGHKITIGWRKHVIYIGYNETPFRGRIVGDDGVTADESCCHADGYEKAIEYLGRLREGLALKLASSQ